MTKKYLINKLADLNNKTDDNLSKKIEGIVLDKFSSKYFLFYKNATSEDDCYYIDVSGIREILNPENIKPEKIENISLDFKWKKIYL